MIIKDQILLAQLRNGDVKVFENLFHRNYSGMCKYAVSILKKDELAEEVVQDVFYNIWKNRRELEIHNLQSYLYRSVYNNSMMILRKHKREIRLDESWAESQKHPSASPVETLDRKEIDDLVVSTLDKLPERTREIFTLNRFEGLRYKEIAEKLSVSVKTVEANMGRALKALRTSLGEYGS
jgi:RNA polymerase sigma-70 factor (ECF subfamily)